MEPPGFGFALPEIVESPDGPADPGGLLSASGQGWPDCDADIAAFVSATVQVLGANLGADLSGVYLHGSLAMGSYYRPKSDIDILVTSQPLTAGQRRQVSRALAEHSATRPTSGDLELSIITEQVAARARAPMLYQVHYSTSWNQRIADDDIDWQQSPEDPDLPAHLMVTRQRGVVLCGPPVQKAIGQVPWPVFLDAVRQDLRWILSGDTLLQMPFYGVLNICRAWHLLSTGEQVVLSKQEGGQWALQHLPGRHHRIITAALDAYRSPRQVPDGQRTTAGLAWDEVALRSLAVDTRELLASTSGDSALEPY